MARTSRRRRSTTGPAGTPPTSSRASAGGLRTRRQGRPLFTSRELSPPRLEERMRGDIVPGAVFPDYALSDHRGKHRTLSELQGCDPVVLVLSRGHGALAE